MRRIPKMGKIREESLHIHKLDYFDHSITNKEERKTLLFNQQKENALTQLKRVMSEKKMQILEEFDLDKILDNLEIYKELSNNIDKLKRAGSREIKIALALLRVSSDQQVEYSPEAQLKDIIRYCLNNDLWLPRDHIVPELAYSGRRAKQRPAFNVVMDYAKTKPKPFDVLLVHRFDRFARSRLDSVVSKDLLRNTLHIDVVSVQEPLPADRKMAMVMEAQLETMAEYYSMNLSDEVKKGNREKAERGEHQGPVGYGYKKVIDRIEKVKDREKIIRRIEIVKKQARFVTLMYTHIGEEKTLVSLVEILRQTGAKTNKGLYFDTEGIRYILRNPIYKGTSHHTPNGKKKNWKHPDTIKCDDVIPKIVSSELWERVQTILNSNEIRNNSHGIRTSVKVDYWLRGLVRCGSCGRMLIKSGSALRCCGYTKGLCKSSNSVQLEKIESIILEQLEHDFKNNPININSKRLKNDFDNGFNLYLDQVEQVKQKLERIKDAYDEGVYDLEEFKARKSEYEIEIKRLNKIIKKLKDEAEPSKVQKETSKHCGDAHKILINENVCITDKRIVVTNLIHKIVFNRNKAKEESLLITYI